MSDVSKSYVNRRDSPRRAPRGHVKVACRIGKLGMGPNLADALLDLSQSGARLAVRTEIASGTEVEMVITAVSQPRPVRLRARVVRTLVEPNGRLSVGVRFAAPLPYGQWQQLTCEPTAAGANSVARSGPSLSDTSPLRSPAES